MHRAPYLEFYLGKFESFSSRPETRRDLAAFSAVTVLLLVSLIVLYQGAWQRKSVSAENHIWMRIRSREIRLKLRAQISA